MKYLMIVLLLNGCGVIDDTDKYKCIDHKQFVKRKTIWIENLYAPPCRSLDEVK